MTIPSAAGTCQKHSGPLSHSFEDVWIILKALENASNCSNLLQTAIVRGLYDVLNSLIEAQWIVL